jgi:hypothetical protein
MARRGAKPFRDLKIQKRKKGFHYENTSHIDSTCGSDGGRIACNG